MTMALLEQEELDSTPTAFFDWSIYAPKSSAQTDRSSPMTFINFCPQIVLSATEIFALGQSVTDVSVQDRFSLPLVGDFSAKNLKHLSAIAKLLIPELREMTSGERRNLHSYYKKVYRKV